MKGFVIAIDGPVASGKGTIAALLARKLNGFHFSTGLTYRALAYFCLDNGINTRDEKEVSKCADSPEIEILNEKVFLNDKDITKNIFATEISQASSDIAIFSNVRNKLVQIQQKIIKNHIEKREVVVVDGRDIATKVWPNAELKIFLTASLKVRAKRRLEQLKNRGESKRLDEVLEDVKNRDLNDTERALDPLVKEPELHGYVIIDNSSQSESQTLGKIESILNKENLL